MDIGGVWNGTTEVTATTGDTVTFTLANSTSTAFDLTTSVALATGFNYVANTASVSAAGAGCGATVPTVTAAQTGTTLNFSFTPAGYDLPASCTLTFNYGLTTASTVIAGTYQMNHQWNYALSNGGALTGAPGSISLNVLVQAGATIISKLPGNQLQPVGAVAAWTVSVNNSGLGGLFDVSVDEYAINPSTALSLSSISVTAPASPASSAPTASKRVLPYLAPGVAFDSTVQATVTSCRNINNTVYTTDRTGTTLKSGTAEVTLDMLLPLVNFTVANYAVPYTGTTPVSITIQNMGAGASANLTVQSQLNTSGITVSNVGAGWSYNATNGVFTYSGGTPAGTLANGASVVLSFDISAANVCTFGGSSNLHWTAQYTDVCGNAYSVPSVLSNITTPAAAPSISVSKASKDNRLVVNTPSNFTLGFSASNTAAINGTSFTVSDTLPTGISAIGIVPPAGTSYTCPGGAVCNPGDVMTWTIPKAALPLPTDLYINYTAPADACVGGSVLTNTATAAATTIAGCNLSASASAGPLMTNNPGATVTQLFDVGVPLAGAAFEAGLADNGNNVRDTNEGEFIPFTATYVFDPAYNGTWAGSTYVDNFGALAAGGATLVSSRLTVSVNGGAAQAVPVANVTCGSGSLAANNCAGSLTLDLTFLNGAAYFNTPNVAGQSLVINYATTVSDANMAATSVNYTQLVKLRVSGGSAGGCGAVNPVYTQGAFVSVARAAPTLAISMPSSIDVCQPLNVTMTVANGTEEVPSNVLATLLTGGSYEYPVPQTPTYGGMFNTGNMTYTEAAGVNPNFALTPTTTTLTSNGSIAFQAELKAGSSTTPAPLQGTLAYDDWQTAGGIRDYSTTGQATPVLIRQGQLVVTVTPQLYTVVDSYASWKVYVTNVGNGTSYAAQLIDKLPTGVTLDVAGTDAANTGQSCAPLANCNVSYVDPYVTWNLGDIPAGASRVLTLKAIMSGATCVIPDGSNQVTGRWGCGGAYHEVVVKNEPNFLFPAGQMQVVHDTTATSAPLCGTGTDVIIVRNTGTPNVVNVVVSEAMNPATSGLDIVPGTVSYSTDSGATWTALGAAGNPTGLGTTASPYQWDKTQIPALANLAPVSSGSGFEVRIKFSISAGELANAVPTIQASATGSISCGDVVNSPGTPYAIPVNKPDFTITKSGINRTVAGGAVGTGAYVGQVYGGVGDKVEWKINVTNNGNYTGFNMRLNDVFAGSGGTTNIIQAPTGFATPVAITNATPMAIPDVPATTTHSYIIEETLGNTCVGWTANANTVDVTWGCVNNGANVKSNLSTPTNNTATANLVMQPGFADFANVPSSQILTYLSSGRVQVDLNMFNGGAVAVNPVLTSTAFPTNMRFDPYGTIKLTGTAVVAAPAVCTTGHCLDGTVTVGGTGTAPTFTLNGTGMRNGTQATLTFYMYPTLFDDQYATVYPDLAAPEANAATGTLDPLSSSYGGTNHSIALDASSTCAQLQTNTNNAVVNPLIPDLDFTTLSPLGAVVTAGQTTDLRFTINNVGDPGSVADNVTVTFPVVGNGFVVNDVYVETSGQYGWNGACWVVGGVWTCTRDHMGFLVQGVDTAVIRANVTVQDNLAPLSLIGEVTGEVLAADRYTGTGTITGTHIGNYSLDRARPKIVGEQTTKTLVSSTEATTGIDAAIGEEMTYNIGARFFGGDPSIPSANTVSAITFRDTLPTGLGLVSYTPTGNNTVTVTSVTGTATPAASNPLKSGRIDFLIADVTTGSGTFDYYVTARVMNIASNTDKKVRRNNFGGTMTYIGQTYRSNRGVDGFTTGTKIATLHAQQNIRVRRPTVTIKKEVRNTNNPNSVFGPESGVNGGDTYEYRITMTTTGSQLPAYDLKLVDVLPNKLILIDSAADGIDNDGDGLTDALDLNGEGTFVAGPGGSILFNDGNTGLPVGSSFGQLNKGSSITLLYRATADRNTIVGGDVLTNTATATYTSLPGPSGNMTAPIRASGAVDGELSADVYASAFLTMARVSGWVYLDGNQNIVHDGFEGGTGLTLYAKIISGGVVQEVQPVNPTTGTFSFGTAAAGNYTVIVDDNNLMTDAVPTIPTGWIGTEAPTQTRSFTLGVGGSANAINFGLFNGQTTFFNGTVFEDNGIGGGIANDGVQNGGELGIPSVAIQLSDCYGTVYGTANTDGTGLFSVTLFNTGGAIADGTTLCIDETNPTNYLSTGGNAGTTGGTYDRTLDRQVVSLTNSTTSTGITFADVSPNRLLTDGQKIALPGTTVVYPHTFTAGTGGSVSFATTAVASPNIPGWAEVLYQDTNCNQVLDAADTQVTAAIPLAAAGSLCLLQKEFVPLNAPYNARNVATLTASFSYTGATPALPVLNYVRNDVTTVGQEGLVLQKTVDKTTALPSDLITYTITYSNPTSAPLSNLIIYDTTPAYTTFNAAACGALPANLTACAITPPAVGVNGAIQWQMTGTLAPASSGSVSYSVQVNP
jgi:fimbrial isopeptide formation D2 family protein/uncharacterized repeat protein (TIGR01451 family)